MAQRHVETVIGRLITDEALRTAFLTDPDTTLRDLGERGLELTRLEIAALVATDREMWHQAARLLDTRLQKASLVRAPHCLPPVQETQDHD